MKLLEITVYKESQAKAFESELRKIVYAFVYNKGMPIDVALSRITVLQQDLADNIRLDEQEEEKE